MRLRLSIKVADLRNDSGSWLLVTHTYILKYTETNPHLHACMNKLICMSTHTYTDTKETFHMYHTSGDFDKSISRSLACESKTNIEEWSPK